MLSLKVVLYFGIRKPASATYLHVKRDLSNIYRTDYLKSYPPFTERILSRLNCDKTLFMHKFVIFDFGGVGLTSYLPKNRRQRSTTSLSQKTWLAFYAGSLVFFYDQVFAHNVQVCAIGHNPPVGRLETRKKGRQKRDFLTLNFH